MLPAPNLDDFISHEYRPLFSVTTCRGKRARIPAGMPGYGPALATATGWPLCFGAPPLSRSMGRTRGDHPENLRLLGGIWRLTQHNRRAEPTPIITVTRGAGVTSWKRTCKAYRFSHITYPGHPLHPENVSSNPNYFLFCLFTSY